MSAAAGPSPNATGLDDASRASDWVNKVPDSGAERELQTWLEQKQAEARLQSVILEQSAQLDAA